MKVGPSRFRDDLTPALNSFREENLPLIEISSLLYRFFFSFFFKGDSWNKKISRGFNRDWLKVSIDKEKVCVDILQIGKKIIVPNNRSNFISGGGELLRRSFPIEGSAWVDIRVCLALSNRASTWSRKLNKKPS